jgi:hypothetical protein
MLPAFSGSLTRKSPATIGGKTSKWGGITRGELTVVMRTRRSEKAGNVDRSIGRTVTTTILPRMSTCSSSREKQLSILELNISNYQKVITSGFLQAKRFLIDLAKLIAKIFSGIERVGIKLGVERAKQLGRALRLSSP